MAGEEGALEPGVFDVAVVSLRPVLADALAALIRGRSPMHARVVQPPRFEECAGAAIIVVGGVAHDRDPLVATVSLMHPGTPVIAVPTDGPGRVAAGPDTSDGHDIRAVLDAVDVTRQASPDVEPNAVERLTAREREVLDLLVGGAPTETLAAQLGLSPHTVRTHVQNVLVKLGASSRFEAVAAAQRLAAGNARPARPSAGSAPRLVGDGTDAVIVLAMVDPLVGAGLAEHLEATGRAVVTTAPEAEIVEELAGRSPSVAIIEATPGGGGVAACAAIKACADPCPVLIVSELPDQDVLRAAVEAGADGYLAAPVSLDDVLTAAERVAAGEAHIPPGMLGTLLRDLIDRQRSADVAVDRFARLSKRERTVLGLLATGHDQEAIAKLLVLSPHTARTHIQNVLTKLDVHSRTEAAALASEFDFLGRFDVDLPTTGEEQ